jgi:hypothetical protein
MAFGLAYAMFDHFEDVRMMIQLRASLNLTFEIISAFGILQTLKYE